MPRIAQQIYMGLGASAAMVDVSSFGDLVAGVSAAVGRDSEFDDTQPGTFEFTLDNSDGRFTPGNTTSATAAGYSSTVSEGMSVCWGLGSRLRHGSVLSIEPAFPGDESAWSQVVVGCDDMLGNAARHELSTLQDGAYEAAGPLRLWRLSDAVGSGAAVAEGGASPQLTINDPGFVTFGSTQSHMLLEPTVTALANNPAFSSPQGQLQGTGFPTLSYPTGTFGSFSFEVELLDTSSAFRFGYNFAATPYANNLTITGGNGSPITFSGLALFGSIVGPIPTAGRVYFVELTSTATFSVGVWFLAYEMLVDGVSYGTTTYSTSFASIPDTVKTPVVINLSATAGTVFFSRLTHTTSPLDEHGLVDTTEAGRLAAIAKVVPEITLDTLPTLSTAPLSVPAEVDGNSALDAINDVIRTEQGYIDTVTTGSVSAPVEKVRIRERTRPTTVTATFNIETECAGAPDFIRDLTNLAQTVIADGPTRSASYRDTTLYARAASKNISEDVLNSDYSDLYTYATDRSVRGANTAMRIASVSIDAMTTPTDRSADLLALTLGSRYQFSGLPSTVLGFSTWDGWLVGFDEVHTLTEHTFTLKLAPVLPATGIYDTGPYMADGCLSLSAGINAAVTSISVATTGATFTTAGGDLPVTIRIDNECMSVTAASGATPQVLTVTRGATDPVTGLATTAATHSSAALVELAAATLYAF